jgi:membrane complex biogenesis BtpA family protein
MRTFRDLFGNKKPVIAMAHLPALPGTPRYDRACGLEWMVERVRTDVKHLVEAGVDAVMFCNEDDRPYTFHAGMEQVAAMTRVVTELRPASIPFGVDFLWDPKAALCIAAATGASFIREVFTGVYESDMGMWAPDVAEIYRLRSNLNAGSLLMFFNIAPEFCSPLGNRSIAQRAKSAVVSSLADVILVSGAMAGSEPDLSAIEEAKQAVGERVPVLLNTGARKDNIHKFLRVADGVIVGSSLKAEGYTWNMVDPGRVKEFLAAARGEV